MREELILLWHYIRAITLRQVIKVAIFLIVIGIFLGFTGFGLWFAAKRGWIEDLFTWIQTLGPTGAIVLFICLAVVNQPLTFGYIPLVLVCGLLFHFIKGMILVVFASFFGSSLAFWICRLGLKNRLEEWLASKGPIVTGVRQDVGRHVRVFGVFIRLTPVPLWVQNALMAISPVSYPMYVFTTTIGMLPEQMIVCYFGTTVRNIADIAGGDYNLGWGEVVVLILSGAASIAVIAFIFLLMLRALRRAKDLEQLQIEEEAIEMREVEIVTDVNLGQEAKNPEDEDDSVLKDKDKNDEEIAIDGEQPAVDDADADHKHDHKEEKPPSEHQELVNEEEQYPVVIEIEGSPAEDQHNHVLQEDLETSQDKVRILESDLHQEVYPVEENEFHHHHHHKKTLKSMASDLEAEEIVETVIE